MSSNQKINFITLPHINVIVWLALSPHSKSVMIPSNNRPLCLELECFFSLFAHHQKALYGLSLNRGKDFFVFIAFYFLINNHLCVQTPREPAEDRRVFSEPDAPDEIHVCGLLFQPSICSQCTHTAQVNEKKQSTWNEIKNVYMCREDTENRCNSSKAY